MHLIFDKLTSLLSNLIGRGMPERIRAIGFSFLGLTAAAGLALVAIFAQMGFQIPSPVPLPSGPQEPSSVSKAVPLRQGPATVGLAQARGAVAAPSPSGGQGDSSGAVGRGGNPRVDGSADVDSSSAPGKAPGAQEPVASPPPAATPEPSPAPAPEAIPAPAPEEIPVSSPASDDKPKSQPAVSAPGKPGPKPAAVKPAKSEGKPAKTRPAKTQTPKSSKPVKSEAKPPKSASKPPKSEAPPASEPSYVPAPSAAPEGKDKLQGEEKDEDK